MLFVLTCADLAAVGPDVLNDWKVDVLAKLYQRMMRHLSGETQSPDADQRLAEQRDKLLTQIQGNADTDWLSEQIESLPGAYLEGPSAGHLIEDLERLKLVEREKPIAWGRYLPDRQVVEYSIGFIENSRRGSFHRLTGALSGKGMEILTAEIHSLANGLCLDRFYVNDQDYRDEPPVDRFREVEERLLNALTTQRYESPTFRQTWQSRRPQAPVTDLPIQVRVDNMTSDSFTIIDVFAHDRPGLLYAIAKTLFDLDLSVAFARIGTYLDQVVDVFYVTDSAGNKVQGDEVHDRIRGTLTKAIELEERKATQ